MNGPGIGRRLGKWIRPIALAGAIVLVWAAVSLALVNPFARLRLAIGAASVVGLAVLVWTLARARARDRATFPREFRTRTTLTLVTWLFIAGCWLYLYRQRWSTPILFADDLSYLETSRDLPAVSAHLFESYNEHLVVLARLWTFAALRASNGWTEAEALARSAVPLYLAALAQLFFIVRREAASPAAGLLAVVLFGLTTSHRETLLWYSASLWLIPLNLLLAAVWLCGSGAIPVGTGRHTAVLFLAALAPLTYTVGLLVGPMATLCLAREPANGSRRAWWVKVLAPAALTLGVGGIVMARLVRWAGTQTYVAGGGRGVMRVFDPLGALVVGPQLVVDGLVFRNLGLTLDLSRTTEPTGWYLIALPFVFLFPAMLWTTRPAAWRVYPAIALIVLSYALVLPFRTWVNYPDLLESNRYQLFAQVGYAWFVAVAAAQWLPRAFGAVAPDARGPSLPQVALLVLLALTLMAVHRNRVRAPVSNVARSSSGVAHVALTRSRSGKLPRSAMVMVALGRQLDESNDFDRFGRVDGGLTRFQHSDDRLQQFAIDDAGADGMISWGAVDEGEHAVAGRGPDAAHGSQAAILPDPRHDVPLWAGDVREPLAARSHRREEHLDRVDAVVVQTRILGIGGGGSNGEATERGVLGCRALPERDHFRGVTQGGTAEDRHPRLVRQLEHRDRVRRAARERLVDEERELFL